MTSVQSGASDDGHILLLGVGDTHGDFAPLLDAASREPAARAVLQVGDLTAGKTGREARPDDDPAALAALPVPLVWVHGNHEHWDLLGQGEERSSEGLRVPGIHLWPGDAYVVPGTAVRVVGLPGNFAPTWYERPKPFPGDRARHFNADDVAHLQRFQRPAVLLMHEAFRGQAPGRLGAMGVPILASLVRRLQPALVLTGHHHTLAAQQHGATLALALPRAPEGYARLWFRTDGTLEAWEFVHSSE